MNKGLEALEETDYGTFYIWENYHDEYEIIKKELKALEIIRRNPYEIIASLVEFDNYREMIEEWYFFSDKKFPFKNEEEYKLVKEVMKK